MLSRIVNSRFIIETVNIETRNKNYILRFILCHWKLGLLRDCMNFQLCKSYKMIKTADVGFLERNFYNLKFLTAG